MFVHPMPLGTKGVTLAESIDPVGAGFTVTMQSRGVNDRLSGVQYVFGAKANQTVLLRRRLKYEGVATGFFFG